MKIHNIKSCRHCPSISIVTNAVGAYHMCWREMKRIEDIDIIQGWCTLPDCKEGKNETKNS